MPLFLIDSGGNTLDVVGRPTMQAPIQISYALDALSRYPLQRLFWDLLTAGAKQCCQEFQPVPAEMSELSPMCLLYRNIEAIQHPQAILSDPGHHHPPVMRFTRTRNQFAPLESIQQARDIRIMSDHAIRNLPARQPFPSAAEDAQNVVLGRREICRLQQPRNASRQNVPGAQQFDVNVFFEASRRRSCFPGWLLDWHEVRLLVITTTVYTSKRRSLDAV